MIAAINLVMMIWVRGRLYPPIFRINRRSYQKYMTTRNKQEKFDLRYNSVRLILKKWTKSAHLPTTTNPIYIP